MKNGLIFRGKTSHKSKQLRRLLAHSVTVVFVCESSEEFKRAILMQHADGRMGDAVEHRGLHGRVVNHVFEDERLPYLKLVVKLPQTHKVAREAGIATETVNS